MIEYLFYTLFFILPLIFYPRTSEVFEFNKIATVYIFTILIVASWIIKMIKEERYIFKRSALDLPFLFFLFSQTLSTIFSIDSRTSIFGYYSRFNGGLLSIICYMLLYWAFISNFNRQSTLKLIKVTLISATIVAVYGILEHFGHSFSCVIVRGNFNVSCWVQDVQSRVFATLGQPNWLAAYLVSLVPLTWYSALNKGQRKNGDNKNNSIIWITISLLFFACILFTKSRSGLLGLATCYIVFWSFYFKKHFKLFLVISFSFFIALAFLGSRVTPSISELMQVKTVQNNVSTDNGEGGTESGAIRLIVWKGAIDVFKHNPILGTGVETFGYSYWQFRPVEHNSNSEWDFLYNKAHNEYLNILANTGIIGFISYAFLVGASIFTLKKHPALLAGYLSILVTNFYGFSVVIISIFTFIFPAIANTLKEK